MLRSTRRWLSHVCPAALLVSVLGAGHAYAAEGIGKALSEGEVSADVRYRFEFVDQNNGLKEAKASTLRTRLGYRTAEFMSTRGFIEFEDIRTIAKESFNSTTNGRSGYSVVADPEVTELNQGYLSFTALPDTDFKLGRQRIVLDNARFVGNVGWRQNEQTFDAVTLVDTTSSKLDFFYAFAENINTVTGGDREMKAHLINTGLDAPGSAQLSAYAYLIDFDDIPRDSAKTFGGRLIWPTDLVGWRAIFTLEYANQSDHKDGDKGIDADYWLGEFEAVINRENSIKVGYEILQGDGYSGFETPLATKHGFNGWADQFLDTPRDGLEDLYVAVVGKSGTWQLMTVYHRFSAEQGGADYGTEWDFLMARQFGDQYSLVTKYARYRAKDFAADTDKVWLQGQVTF